MYTKTNDMHQLPSINEAVKWRVIVVEQMKPLQPRSPPPLFQRGQFPSFVIASVFCIFFFGLCLPLVAGRTSLAVNKWLRCRSTSRHIKYSRLSTLDSPRISHPPWTFKQSARSAMPTSPPAESRKPPSANGWWPTRSVPSKTPPSSCHR